MVYRVLQYGCGPIGCSVVRLAMTKPDIEIVAAVDLVNVGRTLAEVAELTSPLEVSISDDPVGILREHRPDIVLHATGSSLKDIFRQIESIVEHGANVISTSEELSYPFRENPELAARIDALARKNGVTVLGTGVNPGFLMDSWPLFMTAVCQEVRHVEAVRVQDASQRRLPFQKKIGAGTSPEEFDRLVKDGHLRHVGLPESVAMIAAGLRWELDGISEEIEPVIAENEISTDFLKVMPGQVAGLTQIGRGMIKEEEVIRLVFKAYVGADDPHDAVVIEGTPGFKAIIKGGVHGDLATAAMAVNAIPRVMDSRPGLVTMKDLPPPAAIPSKTRGPGSESFFR
ncbi:MAG: dihydrodipicolinate reductase [Deltaproteobacteria bacterium]|nr:dihydrodipicolinate reductase [Deltaproteobacteria bacterium]